MSFSIFNVNPGDLITADFMNSVLQELSALDSSVTSLASRVTALEQELGSPPIKTSKETKEKDTKETKEKDTKETKEGKEGKEIKEIEKETFLEGKGGKEVIKDVEKGKETEKSVEKTVERKLTDKVLAEKTRDLLMEQAVAPVARVADAGVAPVAQVADAAVAPVAQGAPVAPVAQGEAVAVAPVAQAETAEPAQLVAEHFISPELRPELAVSALRSEPDQVGSDSGGAS